MKAAIAQDMEELARLLSEIVERGRLIVTPALSSFPALLMVFNW